MRAAGGYGPKGVQKGRSRQPREQKPATGRAGADSSEGQSDAAGKGTKEHKNEDVRSLTALTSPAKT